MIVSEMNVDLIDHMGSDLSVVNAARVSFNKTSDWEYWTSEDEPEKHNQPKLSQQDEKLIRYLAKHNHWSPFAHTSIQFRVKAPIFVVRQLAKHQVGASFNEVSRRYVDSEPEFWFPKEWRGRPEGSMKQGSSGVVNIYARPKAYFPQSVCQMTLQCYNDLLEDGVAPEMARMILPQNMMTEWYWTGSLMFFVRVCKLRFDSHAQEESRMIAKMIGKFCQELFPVSWNCLMGENQ